MRKLLFNLMLAAVLPFWAGCGGDDDKSLPRPGGANNINLIVAMGDSITTGEEMPSIPNYPTRLAQWLGKTVVNEGHGGDESAAGAAKVNAVLARNRPGFVIIMYGANDCMHGVNIETAINNLRTMVVACKNNQSVPLLATIPPRVVSPRYRGGQNYNTGFQELNRYIRDLAKEQGVTCVDTEFEFDGDGSLFKEDGIHPNEGGTQLLAAVFYDYLKTVYE